MGVNDIQLNARNEYIKIGEQYDYKTGKFRDSLRLYQ